MRQFEMPLEEAVAEIQILKKLWREERFDDYFPRARAFRRRWREPIHNAASKHEPSLTILRCLQGLLVIHDIIATGDEEAREADEDLYLETAVLYRPAERYAQLKHKRITYTQTSNILKRRAFAAFRLGLFSKASSLFEQAAVSAEQTLSYTQTDRRKAGAVKHFEYLRFHGAITAMLCAELECALGDAKHKWREAKDAAAAHRSPSGLFKGRGYILSRNDLDTYIHLIRSLAEFRQRRFSAAIKEYTAWLEANQEFRTHWRFRNVVLRRSLAQILNCLKRQCKGCPICSDAATDLESVLRRLGIGRAGRELARTGLALYRLGRSLERSRLIAILDDAVFPLLPIGANTTESIAPAVGNYVHYLPQYFIGLSTEVKRLQSFGDSDSGTLCQFVWKRLREFVEICAEYEQGRAAVCFDYKTVATESVPDVSQLLSSLIDARKLRKGEGNPGTIYWTSVKNQIGSAEGVQDLDTVLDLYEFTTKKMAGYFPALVRVLGRDFRGTDRITRVEQLGGNEIDIESQFRLDGDMGYLPPRYVRQPLQEALRQNDRDKWIIATKAKGVFLLQGIPVWEGAWSDFEAECESHNLDFKEAKPKSVAKHLAAFANSDGGWLVFGVRDPEARGRAEVFRSLSLDECTRIVDAVSCAGLEKLSPVMVPSSFFRANPRGKLVILCRIDRSFTRPHRVDGKIYLRIGAMSMPVTDEQWKEFLEKSVS